MTTESLGKTFTEPLSRHRALLWTLRIIVGVVLLFCVKIGWNGATLRTEKQRAQAAVARTEDFGRILIKVEGVPPRSHIVAWNAGATRLLGYDADEMMGQDLSRLAPDNAHDRFVIRMLSYREENPWKLEGPVVFMRKGGELITLEATVRDLEGDVELFREIRLDSLGAIKSIEDEVEKEVEAIHAQQGFIPIGLR